MTITKLIIPAAGNGTRLGVHWVAKPMMPFFIEGTILPAIGLIVREAIQAGITDICVIVNDSNKENIEEYFIREKEKGNYETVNFTYIIQKEKKGNAHAINLAKNFVGDDENFAVAFPDDLFDSDCLELPLQQLIYQHETTKKCAVGCLRVETKDISKYGIAKTNENGDIVDFVEKPQPSEAPSNLAGIGRYIVPRQFFNVMENLPKGAGGEYQIVDAIKELILQGFNFMAYPYKGVTYLDTGNPYAYAKAYLIFAMQNLEDAELLLTEAIKTIPSETMIRVLNEVYGKKESHKSLVRKLP
ncbi:MAG: sugar phosphate nucleotidyltransferase [bacterium]|nr:sugar phosphate nucleotidyltransferase [bacterium]